MMLSYSCVPPRKSLRRALLFLCLFGMVRLAPAQLVENGLLKVGGFRCASVKPLKNDSSLDLYTTGYWNYTGFRMEVWRRLGVPFWYPKGTGVVRVAGEGWHPELGDDISSADAGGKASEESSASATTAGIDPHVDDENAPSNANDQDKSTAWRPRGRKPSGKLMLTFASVARVNKIRFLSDDAPRNTPRDYSVGLILPDGSSQEIASIGGESSIGGTWREFAVPGVEAKGIYLYIRSSNDGKHAPVINEFEAKGEFMTPPAPPSYPSQVVIPMGGYAGTDLHFIGNVGSGFPAASGRADAGGRVRCALCQRAKLKISL